MATITPTSKAGAIGKSIPVAAAASGGDVVVNTNGGVRLLVRNAHVSQTRTVTIKSYTAVTPPPGMAKADYAVVVAAGNVAEIGPFDAAYWNNPSGQIELTYSDAAADLTVGAFTA